MKPSKKIKEIENVLKEQQPNTGNEVLEYAVYCANMKARAIIQYLDEQAELLDTHTVKEDGCSSKCRREGICEKCAFTEEPTTPEKKCCENLLEQENRRISDEVKKIKTAGHEECNSDFLMNVLSIINRK